MIRRLALLLTAAGFLTTTLALGLQTAANAAPAQLPVTLSAAKDGSAAWDASGDPVLANGTSGAAYVDLKNVLGTAAPGTAPGFSASAEAAGAVRWVIEFHNGQYLFGYPAGTGTTVDTWVCNPGGTPTTDYATALKACQPGYDDWVTAAFIVYDQSAHLGPVTLTGIQYNGAQVQKQVSNPFSMKNVNSGKCLDVTAGAYAPGTGLQQWTCGALGGANQHFTYWTFADGSQYLQANGGSGNLFVNCPAQAAQCVLTGHLTPYTYSAGGYYAFTATGTPLYLDVRGSSLLNGAIVHGWNVKTGGANQKWALVAA